MPKASYTYVNRVVNIIEQVFQTQAEALDRATQAIAGSIEQGGILHIFGTGHSHILAEEAFYRAGGLVPVNPILDAGLLFGDGAVKSTFLERVEGYAEQVLSRHHLMPCDVMMIASNSGRNAVPIEMALQARKLGLVTIAITSIMHSGEVASRHSSGRKLMDICDITIDNGGVPGDAIVELANSVVPVGASSTVVGAAIVNSMVVGVVEALAQKGITPPVFISSNLDGGDNANGALIEQFRGRIRDL